MTREEQVIRDFSAEIIQLRAEIERLQWAKAESDGKWADANAEIEQLKKLLDLACDEIKGLRHLNTNQKEDIIEMKDLLNKLTEGQWSDAP